MVLRRTWDDPVVTAAGFIGDHRLVLAFANSTANTVTRTVKIKGVASFMATAAVGYESGVIVDKSSSIHFKDRKSVV